jgi:hypothetical protein
MKTRTLLLLALGCGLLIMLAGAVFLFQLSGQDEIAPPVPIGEVAMVGDMSVTVEGVAESDGMLDVTVTLGGVDDSEGAGGFRLLASGRPIAVDAGGGTGGEADCGSTTIVSITCHVRFDVSSADGSSRILFYERGDDRARWVLG